MADCTHVYIVTDQDKQLIYINCDVVDATVLYAIQAAIKTWIVDQDHSVTNLVRFILTNINSYEFGSIFNYGTPKEWVVTHPTIVIDSSTNTISFTEKDAIVTKDYDISFTLFTEIVTPIYPTITTIGG